MSLREVLLIMNLRVIWVHAVRWHRGATEWRRGTAVDGGCLCGDIDRIYGVQMWWCAMHLDNISSIPRQVAANIAVGHPSGRMNVTLRLRVERSLSCGLVGIVVLHIGGAGDLIIGVHTLWRHTLGVAWYL